MSNRLAFLTDRPIAHRGLHVASLGRIENTLSAVEAAVACGFAIEVDLQPTRDGEVAVFHDDTLDRLTTQTGALTNFTLGELKAVPFKDTQDRIPSLQDLLDLVAGRAPLVIEIKGFFDRQHGAFVLRIVDILKSYDGPYALMSFDPWVMRTVRTLAPQTIRGLLSYDFQHPEDVQRLGWITRFELRHLVASLDIQPDFIAYGVHSLPAWAPATARNLLGKPLLTWTVRNAQDRRIAATYADQIIFEGFDPDAVSAIEKSADD